MSVTFFGRRGAVGHDLHRHGFVRHFAEMMVAMMAGMVVSAAVFLSATGLTVDQALSRHAVLFVVAQAFGMTVAMVAWMHYRGHEWRACSEMAAAMVVPAVPLIVLRVTHVVSGSICGVYCLATVLAMLLVMLYRRNDYGGVARRPLIADS